MSDQVSRNHQSNASFSRRDLLKKSAAALYVTSAATGAATTLAASASAEEAPGARGQGSRFAFVSNSYNTDTTLNGISTFVQNSATGSLTFLTRIASANNPSWLAFDPKKNFLYAGTEVSPGACQSFRINSDGSLTLINTVPSAANAADGGPAHVSVHPSGKYLLAASWGGASFSVLPVNGDGSLSPPVFSMIHTGDLGPNQTQAHPHMIQADPSGNFVLLQDLGQDRTYIFTLDLKTGALSPGPTPFVQSQPGSGPRHFAFHPDGVHMYSLNEVGSSLNVYLWDPAKGSLLLQNTLTTLPPAYSAAKGMNTCAEVAVSKDGNSVYCSNRFFDCMATFSIRNHGRELQGAEPRLDWVRGEIPRHFALAPDGRFLYAENQVTHTIAIFRVDAFSGELVFTGEFAGTKGPTCMIFKDV